MYLILGYSFRRRVNSLLESYAKMFGAVNEDYLRTLLELEKRRAPNSLLSQAIFEDEPQTQESSSSEEDKNHERADYHEDEMPRHTRDEMHTREADILRLSTCRRVVLVRTTALTLNSQSKPVPIATRPSVPEGLSPK
jgi:hypothetical protein